ncbi:glycosyltransferase family 2 protein [Candidatus Gracilibacteria bacterium]|nr:glycosyltransferase family 2 protein [Candidatus Gracilibacteria bacterium]
MSQQTVSVIVPVYNGGESFRQCLSSLAQTNPQPHEIIVVADGDTDGSRDVARATGVRLIVRDTPGGPALARNLGANAACGTLLYFVDADVTLPSDAIGQVMAAFTAEPELSALIGSYDDAPGDAAFLSQYKNLLHHYVHQRGHEQAWTFWGACGAIRREDFIAVGGFDEGYNKPSIEDIELGARLVQRGHRIRLLKALQVKHLKRWTATSLLRTDFTQRALPWTALLLKSKHMPNDLNLGLTSRLSVICAHGLVGALLISLIQPRALLLAAVQALGLTMLNFPLYRFFASKRGPWFALRSMPWHWLYYWYGGLAFAIGFARHHLGDSSAETRVSTTPTDDISHHI